MGGNGSENIDYSETFYQEGEKLEYKGPDNRSNLAMRLVIDSLKEIKNDISEIKLCKDDCNLGGLKDHVGYIEGVIKEASPCGDSVEQGLVDVAAQSRFTKGMMKAVAQGKNTIFTTALKGAFGFILLILALGVIEYLKKKIGVK